MAAYPPASFFNPGVGIGSGPMGTPQSTYGQGWNIPAGNFLTNPYDNYLLDLVEDNQHYLAGPYQASIGQPPQLDSTTFGLFPGFGYGAGPYAGNGVNFLA